MDNVFHHISQPAFEFSADFWIQVYTEIVKVNTFLGVSVFLMFQLLLKVLYLLYCFFVNSYKYLFLTFGYFQMVKTRHGLRYVELDLRSGHILILSSKSFILRELGLDRRSYTSGGEGWLLNLIIITTVSEILGSFFISLNSVTEINDCWTSRFSILAYERVRVGLGEGGGFL